MEKVYPYSQFPSSEPFPLEEYSKSFQDDVKLDEEPGEIDNFNERLIIFDYLGLHLPASEQQKIQKMCGIENLQNANDPEPESLNDFSEDVYITLRNPTPITAEARKCEAVKVREETLKTIDHFYYRRICGKEYGNAKLKPNPISLDDLVPGSDYLVTIKIFRPFLFQFETKNFSNKLKAGQQIQAIGGNRLSQIRDLIICSLDKKLCKEIEGRNIAKENKEEENPLVLYPSNFLFIENVFYNDLRATGSIDYSEVIREWAKEKNIKDLKTADMDGTFVKDLKPRIGYPYVYVHQGNCEHLVVFTDARLLMKDDCLCPYDYPYVMTTNRQYSRKCAICGTNNAQVVCTECDRLPNEHMLMCQECFDSYHNVDGRKIDSCKAYAFSEIIEDDNDDK
ncbi:snRNA-activating protein complex subunit 3-like [Agrilus planipennis]|uniref:snRNA-activating protein complex subunit 3 n=2 Tax=Agrilus planipennis TaxID=224129 RepID=A0A7F5RJ23_AGRPL|nr:snRNA-activating protein complex subunit 3-like [Agrilus planipennis]